MFFVLGELPPQGKFFHVKGDGRGKPLASQWEGLFMIIPRIETGQNGQQALSRSGARGGGRGWGRPQVALRGSSGSERVSL